MRVALHLKGVVPPFGKRAIPGKGAWHMPHKSAKPPRSSLPLRIVLAPLSLQLEVLKSQGVVAYRSKGPSVAPLGIGPGVYRVALMMSYKIEFPGYRRVSDYAYTPTSH